MAILRHVVDHRCKGLRMHVVIVTVHERDTLVAAQVVKCLLERQAETLPELGRKNQRPFQFVILVICHVLLPLQHPAAKLLLFFEICKKNDEKFQKLIV